MAYDFLSGQFGATRGSGFGGRATGGRFANIYGYNQGQAVTDPQQMAQIRQQQTQPVSNPGASNDFFSQLAGLINQQQASGGSPMQNPNVQPRQTNPFQSMFNAGNSFNRNSQIRTDGGVGPYGGIRPENQRAMFEGRARGFGSMGQSPFRFGGGR